MQLSKWLKKALILFNTLHLLTIEASVSRGNALALKLGSPDKPMQSKGWLSVMYCTTDMSWRTKILTSELTSWQSRSYLPIRHKHIRQFSPMCLPPSLIPDALAAILNIFLFTILFYHFIFCFSYYATFGHIFLVVFFIYLQSKCTYIC